MILEKGNMWDVFRNTDYFFITTNSFIKKDGSLVMGAGIARQLRDKVKGIDYLLGQEISKTCGHLGTYGIMIFNHGGIFQVKHHFKQKAKTELIEESTKQLSAFATSNKHFRIDINFPGIGNGGLTYDEVYPIIEVLPDNVHVWRF